MTDRYRKHQDSIIQKYLSMIIQYDLQDEDYGIVTISNVEITSDYSKSWITVNTTASTEKKMELTDLLNENSGYIRSELADVLQIRHTPELIFKADLSRESEQSIEQILSEASPVPEEEIKDVLKKEKGTFRIPERKTSLKTDLRSTNQTKPDPVHTERMTVKSSKSSTNKQP